MELGEIDQSTPLRLSVEGRRLVVEPVADEPRRRQFDDALEKTLTRHSRAFEKLAE